MKTYTILFGILTVVSLIGGLFCKTPFGEPATHQLHVAMFCGVLTVAFGIEHLRTRKVRRS